MNSGEAGPGAQGRLVLLRHAQGSLGTSNYDRLSATGLRQALHTARHLESVVDRAEMVCGELRRHRETARYLHHLGTCTTDPDLNEYQVDHLLKAAFARADRLGIPVPGPQAAADPAAHLDTFLSLFPRVLEAWQGGWIDCRSNGLWKAFSRRVEAAGRRLVLRLEQSNAVVAVTSAGVISTLVSCLLERDLAWQRELNVSLYNASITELWLNERGDWSASRINCIAHLPSDELHTLA